MKTSVVSEQPSKIRVVRGDTLLTLTHPAVLGDSLAGTSEQSDLNQRVALAFHDVDSLATRQPNRKAMRIMAVSSVALAVVFVVLASSGKPITTP